MKSIRAKILLGFFLAALASITMLGLAITWQLNISLSEQSDQLAAEMTERIYQNLAYPEESFRVRLRKDIRRIADNLRQEPGLVASLKERNFLSLQAQLARVAKKEPADVVALFDMEGRLQASFPAGLNTREIERDFQRSIFEAFRQRVLNDELEGQEAAIDDELFSLPPETLRGLKLERYDVSENGTLGIAAVGAVLDDFGEPAGLCFVGKVLNNYGELLTEIRDTGGYAAAIFLENRLLLQAGFTRTDVELAPDIARQVLQSQSSVRQMLTVGTGQYIASCSSLRTVKGKAHGILCVGVPEVQVQSAIHKVMLLGSQTRRHILGWILYVGVAALAIFTLLSLLIASRLTRPIVQIAQLASQVAKGDLSGQLMVRSHDEVGQVAKAFREMMEYIRSVAGIAQKVSTGAIDVRITPRSEHDILNLAFAETIQYIQDVATVTEKISHKELQVEITPKSEQDVLNLALQRMVFNLQEMMLDIETSMSSANQLNWIRTGQAELNTRLRGEQRPATLARQIISYLATYLNAQLGAIYLMDESEEHLCMIGSYAYSNRKGNRNEIPLGKGLVGQVALEKQRILFSDIPEEYVTIGSGLGEIAPKFILLAPFLYESDVKGVIELGALDAFTSLELDFIDQVLESVAIAFHSAQSRLKMHELLEETQRQAEELQSQQEQLSYSNKELEKQATALQRSEEKLRAQQEELRQTNEELIEKSRALERQQQGLREKNRELEQARLEIERKAEDLALSSRYKSEFLANMSHELRTPLNSMLILSRLLAENKEGNLDEKQVKSAQTIHAAGSDLLRLINDILDLSKVESGKMAINLEAMSIQGLAQYVRQHFQHVTDEKGLFLDIDIDDTLPESLVTAQQRVEQIVKNFLSNAIKFTTEGGITVRIVRPKPETTLSHSGLVPQETVAIAVHDTGIGIPEEKQRLIFEAFQQADGTTSRRYGGTGLGLSISREMATLLGGEVQLHSQEGEGSVFSLFLPKNHPERPEIEAAHPSDTEKETSKPAIGTDSIRDDRHDAVPNDRFLLIVEPDAEIARSLFHLGREKGFKCLLAGDGAAGLQLADQYEPVAIMLDLELPDMEGRVVLERLRVQGERQTIPVHLISTESTTVDTEVASEIKRLVKPITTEKLDEAFRHIEQILSQQIKKLLVVEPDSMTRKSILTMLAEEDIAISSATSGQEMLRFLETENFDCIVMDLDIEEDADIDLLDEIKKKIRTSHVPLVVFTGQELTQADELNLRQYVVSIVVKEGKAMERLMDEVTLFLHQVEKELPEPQTEPPRALRDRGAVLAGKQILVVDDDMRNVFALMSVLEEREMDVLAADSGQRALEILDEQPDIDLVLMDIMMPEMDGYETMQRIRQQEKFKQLPILALTAKAMKGDRQKCLDAGASDYLSKPIDTDKLLSLLRVWLYK